MPARALSAVSPTTSINTYSSYNHIHVEEVIISYIYNSTFKVKYCDYIAAFMKLREVHRDNISNSMILTHAKITNEYAENKKGQQDRNINNSQKSSLIQMSIS